MDTPQTYLLRNVPADVYSETRRLAKKKGRTLRTQLIFLMEDYIDAEKAKEDARDRDFSPAESKESAGDEGKKAETQVQEILTKWKTKERQFDFDRLLDSKAAGAIVAAQVSDFLLFFCGKSATLEVKQLKSGVRLGKAKFPQHPRMLRRELAGCKGFLIAHTMDNGLWWVARVTSMEIDVPSWKLTERATKFDTVTEAMEYVLAHM